MVRLPDLQAALARRQASPEPPARGRFERATFRCELRGASVTASGGWKVVIEVPYADREAFFPVTQAAGLELVATVHRKPAEGRAAAG